jgi:outer membrane murein-binding lipoprotein Lpp
MWIDISIATVLAILTIGMAYLGVHVTLHPADSPKAKFRYKFGFSACAVGTVLLVVWQGVRNGASQSAFVKRVSDLTSQVSTLQSEVTATKQQVTYARSDQQTESTRRQQAEKDLAVIVQGTGKSTREGVAEDIKKSPIKVQVAGGSVETAPLQTEDVRILQSVVRSTHSDAAYAAQWIIQANVPINLLRRLITCNVPLKFIESRPSNGLLAFLGGALDPIRIWDQDKTKVIINLVGQPGTPIFVPEQSIIIHIYAESGPITIKSVDVGPR